MIETGVAIQASSMEGIRVLVLDDEATVRRWVRRALAARGGEVVTARDGREGLQRLLDQDVDVVAVDVMMDGMDGPTFLREARKIWPWLGAVVMTGFAQPAVVSALRDLGVERFLYGHVPCVCMVDVDHFKQINDRRGHLAGDRVLVELSRRIRAVCRETDVIGRYGGDEIVVALPEGGRIAGRALAERLRADVRSAVFPGAGTDGRMTVSIGVSATDPGPRGPSVGEVLKQADQALYEAKRRGRDRVVVWDRKRVRSREPARAPQARPRQARPVLARPEARVLLVDDDPDLQESVARMLDRQGFRVDGCGAAAEAADRLADAPGRYDVVLTDLQMPGGTGLDLLREITDLDRDLVKIVITGHATVENAVQSLRHGAYDFIEKPIRAPALTRILNRAVEYRRLLVENRNYRLYLEEMVQERSAALAEALDELKESYDFTLEAMVALLDAREHATAQHTARVRAIAELLARAMGLPESDVTTIGRGALLHDIGKIAIPDHILLKPAALTDHEQRIMQTHPEVGFNVLASSRTLRAASEIVRSHHERFDGSGYPRGVRGSDICLGARIFAVADAYDAMRSNRPYRASMSVADAVAEIRRGGGTQFDPDVVRLFLDHIDAVEAAGQWGDQPAGG